MDEQNVAMVVHCPACGARPDPEASEELPDGEHKCPNVDECRVETFLSEYAQQQRKLERARKELPFD